MLSLYNPSNAEGTFVQSTKMERFLKKHLNPVMFVTLAEYSQMSAHLPGFQSFFRSFALSCILSCKPLCCWWLIRPLQNDAKNTKMTETFAGTHLRILSERYPMNTNMTGPCAFDKSSLSIGRVK